MATLEGRMVQCRPLPATGLRLVDYKALMENMPRLYPFELVGARSMYQDAVHHLFIDQAERDHIDDLYMIDLPKAGQPAPVVNMVSIH